MVTLELHNRGSHHQKVFGNKIKINEESVGHYRLGGPKVDRTRIPFSHKKTFFKKKNCQQKVPEIQLETQDDDVSACHWKTQLPKCEDFPNFLLGQ